MRRGSVVMPLIRILWDCGGGNKNFAGLNLVTGLCNGGGDEEEEKVVASIAMPGKWKRAAFINYDAKWQC